MEPLVQVVHLVDGDGSIRDIHMKQWSEQNKKFRLGDDEAKHMNISTFLNRGEIKI